jgi:hypothetical protein
MLILALNASLKLTCIIMATNIVRIIKSNVTLT